MALLGKKKGKNLAFMTFEFFNWNPDSYLVLNGCQHHGVQSYECSSMTCNQLVPNS
jgi:hypothetical protein